MPRPQKIEKSKDFKGSVKKLIKSLKGFHVAILVGLVLAMASSILSLVAPNRLADITDYITAGLKPNVDKLQVVNKEIYGQAISTFTAFYYGRDNLGDEQKALLDAIGTEDPNDDIVAFINLDEATLNSIVYTVIIDDVKITKEDQFKYFEIMKSMNQDMVNEDLLKKFDEMPEIIQNFMIKLSKKLEITINHTKNKKIPSTNNLAELLFRVTFPGKIKRIFRTYKGAQRQIRLNNLIGC